MNETEFLPSDAIKSSVEDVLTQELSAGQVVPSVAPLSSEMIQRRLSVQQHDYPVIPGLVGALLGSIPGILAWIILGQVGFIAGICGWVMIQGATFGYTKLAGGIDRRGTVLSTIVALCMPIVSEYLGLAVSVYRNFHDSYGVTVGDAIRAVPLYLAEPEVLQGIVFSLILGYVLIAYVLISASANRTRTRPIPVYRQTPKL